MAAIDKASAAERMIVSAIIMADRGEDRLAIHVVAASALNVLRDLIEKSGDEYVEQAFKIGLFAMATARLRGETLNLPTNDMIDEIVANVAGGIDAGEVKEPADLILALDAAQRRAMLGYIVKPYNFLKHADRDPLATLDEGDIDPDGAISHALSALTMVLPGKALPETVRPYLEKHGLL